MSRHTIHFESTGNGMVLTNAILLYRHEALRRHLHQGLPRYDGAAFASIHSVELDDEGRPIITAGKALTHHHMRQWTDALGRTTLPELLPDNILVSHPDMLVWWSRAQVRPAYFALSGPPPGLRVLFERTIVPVPYPAHLFVATRAGLRVFALPTNRRPRTDTRLLHSPVLNVFVDGYLCWGNISRPKALAIASIPDFERAVFDSWSTHPNPGQERTISGRGGLVGLWDDLAARAKHRFPIRRLKPFGTITRRQSSRGAHARTMDPMTVGQLISQGRPR